eukprot:CAMPEP_0170160366 /NCGR_PEP_ID=MMETSP0033_2-20121228/73249_1 /TAXON_ID=195969 /ORGANISM="Dolichomastix tenuilepis, Strain CCMP3274" /LENGTH=105 /DNA_ID=CAMNT_0010397911 /DNA_START=214 /DNA_END=529 /DNA_ORIENTATION=+
MAKTRRGYAHELIHSPVTNVSHDFHPQVRVLARDIPERLGGHERDGRILARAQLTRRLPPREEARLAQNLPLLFTTDCCALCCVCCLPSLATGATSPLTSINRFD